MVRVQEPSEWDRLDARIRELAGRHGLYLDVAGWTRRTWNLYVGDRKAASSQMVARVEAYATVNGEITVLDDRALPFAQDLGKALEEEFGVAEAVIRRAHA